MTRRAPEACDYTFHTTAGAVTFRAWRYLSPHGADRLHNLARLGYYDSTPIHRVLPGFVAHWGVPYHASVARVYDWRNNVSGAVLPDETPWPVEGDNTKHWMAFGARTSDHHHSSGGASTNRTGELFVSLVDNSERLRGKGFAAFAYVIRGAETLDRWYAGYGEMEGLCGGGAGSGPGWLRSSPSPSTTADVGAFSCLGPRESDMYGLGSESLVNGNFSKMDRIARVDVREYGGAWGHVPGPGHQLLSLSLVVLFAFAAVVCTLRKSAALKEQRAYWAAKMKPLIAHSARKSLNLWSAAIGRALDTPDGSSSEGSSHGGKKGRGFGVFDVVTMKVEKERELGNGNSSDKPYSIFYMHSAAAASAAKLAAAAASAASAVAATGAGKTEERGGCDDVEVDGDDVEVGVVAAVVALPADEEHDVDHNNNRARPQSPGAAA